MSGLIEMVGLLANLALLARIVETSRVLVSFTNRGRQRAELDLPSLIQS